MSQCTGRRGRRISGILIENDSPVSVESIMLEPVFFLIGTKLVESIYARRDLRLGAIVHVSFGDDGSPLKFTNRASAGAVPHSVTWIAPSDWSVYLAAGYEASEDVARSLHVTGLDAETIRRAIAAASRSVRLEHLYKTKEVEQSAINVFTTVGERLRLVELLSSQATGRELGAQQEPLITYLLLTCCDRLGQPARWLDFGSWLASNTHADEREATLARENGASPLEQAQALYKEYGARYGVQNAFFRFFDEVLPEDARADLLSCIQIGKLRNPPDLSRLPVREFEKAQWLLRLRNNYTHYGRFMPGIAQHDQVLLGITPDMWQMAREQRIDPEVWTDVTLKNWPHALKEAVRRGFAAYVTRIAQTAPPNETTQDD